MTQRVEISVVIATWNRGEKLLRTLQSLANQVITPAAWEAVVVNNNSTDSTAEVFARFAADHPELQLRMVDEPRQGLSWARNCGIAESRGELIAIIDDDEEVNPQFCSAYINFFARHPNVLIAGGAVTPIYEADRPRWMSRFTERPIAGTLQLGPLEKPFVRGYPPGGNMAVRRCAIDDYGVFDTSLGRTGAQLIGGEEKELNERITFGSRTRAWWVPGAEIRHIIPPSKLTESHLQRLWKGVGVSARLHRGVARAIFGELLKWPATLLIAIFMRPAQARYLIKMRLNITKGILSRA